MLDLDGTLLTSDKKITEKSIDALRYAKSKGMYVGIATGRASFMMDKFIKEFNLGNLIDFVVGYNGVEVKDYQNHTLEVSDMMTGEMTRELAIKSRNMPWNLVAYDEHCRYAKVADSHIVGYAQATGHPYAVYDFETGDREWAKVSFYTFDNAIFTEEEYEMMYPLMTDCYHGFRTSPYTFEVVNALRQSGNRHGKRHLFERDTRLLEPTLEMQIDVERLLYTIGKHCLSFYGVFEE